MIVDITYSHMLRALVLLLSCFIVSACGDDVVRIEVHDERKDPDMQIMYDACEILDIACSFMADRSGTVHGGDPVEISVVPQGPDYAYRGRHLHDGTCMQIVWAVDRDDIIAHELGHALGLDHVDDVDNLMNPCRCGAHDPEGMNVTVTGAQQDTLETHVRRLAACLD